MRVDRQSLLGASAIIGLLFISPPASAAAQGNVQGVCVLNCGPAPSPYNRSIYVRPAQPSPAELQNRQAIAINEQAIATHRRGDEAQAVPLYQQALAFATNANTALLIRHNMAAAYSRLALAVEHRDDLTEAFQLLELDIRY